MHVTLTSLLDHVLTILPLDLLSNIQHGILQAAHVGFEPMCQVIVDQYHLTNVSKSFANNSTYFSSTACSSSGS